MVRSATHSSYPAEPADAAAEIAVAEQSRAFLDVVGDGWVGWSGPLSHVASRLAGVELDGDAAWPDPRVVDRRPVLVGEVARREQVAVDSWRRARGVTPKPVKVALPGPVTFVSLSDDRHYGQPVLAAAAVARALAEEVAALGEAGCRWFQLEEPRLVTHPHDLDLVAASCRDVFAAAPEGSVTVLSTWFGPLDLSRDGLERLPGTHLGLDATSPDGLAVLGRLPEGRGVALGLFDARTEEAEDPGEVAARLAPWKDVLLGRDVLVGPNAGLAPLPLDAAYDKLLHARYLAEQLRREWGLGAPGPPPPPTRR